MRKFTKQEIDYRVEKITDDYICGCGLKNAKKILMLAYRRIRVIEKRLEKS